MGPSARSVSRQPDPVESASAHGPVIIICIALFNEFGPWIIHEESVKEIGCIYTYQGLELDYVGVIVGSDLAISSGELITDPAARAKSDKSLNGYKKDLGIEPIAANEKADEIIRNTYRTLMTRGMKGCYVYFIDQATADCFKELLPA